MTESEYIESAEYRKQKRIAYFDSKRKIKHLGKYAHKKAMKYYNDNILTKKKGGN